MDIIAKIYYSSIMAINLIDLLEAHAVETLETSPTNALYADRVRQSAVRVGELLTTRTGELISVVSTWRSGFKPIAEAVFGISLELWETDTLQVTHAEFLPTVIDGILGRVNRLSDDEIMGPLLSLDLIGESSVE